MGRVILDRNVVPGTTKYVDPGAKSWWPAKQVAPPTGSDETDCLQWCCRFPSMPLHHTVTNSYCAITSMQGDEVLSARQEAEWNATGITGCPHFFPKSLIVWKNTYSRAPLRLWFLSPWDSTSRESRSSRISILSVSLFKS